MRRSGSRPTQVVVSDYGFAPLARPPRAADPEGRLRIGFVGTLVWHKGADVLIDAVSRLPGERVEVRIFGDPGVFPEYAATLRQRARGLPVRFLAGSTTIGPRPSSRRWMCWSSPRAGSRTRRW